MSCSSSCPTKNHASWGECVRSKRLTVAGADPRAYNQRQNKGIDNYVAARQQGIQPATIFPNDVAVANAISDRYGEAYQDGTMPAAAAEELA